ncbi:MAG: YceI family protein [Flavobacteriales bacterium]|nr:YceI family protein [Flavobacteriales bacterium]
MKKIGLMMMFAALSVISFAHIGTGRMNVDISSSTIQWTGNKVTGSHTGMITVKAGSVSVENGELKHADVTVDMNSMTCTDADMSDEYKQKLIGHLKSPDFFGTAEHATSNFVLTKFTKGKDGMYDVTGVLTIKGIKNEVNFPARVQISEKSVTVDADMTFDRSKYDIRYGSGSFFDGLGDNLIYDDVELKLHVVASI